MTGVEAGDYEIGTALTTGCDVVDKEDTSESAAPVTGPLSAYGLGSQTVTCTYTDAGGLKGEDSVTYTIVDTDAPPSATWARRPLRTAPPGGT